MFPCSHVPILQAAYSTTLLHNRNGIPKIFEGRHILSNKYTNLNAVYCQTTHHSGGTEHGTESPSTAKWRLKNAWVERCRFTARAADSVKAQSNYVNNSWLSLGSQGVIQKGREKKAQKIWWRIRQFFWDVLFLGSVLRHIKTWQQ